MGARLHDSLDTFTFVIYATLAEETPQPKLRRFGFHGIFWNAHREDTER